MISASNLLKNFDLIPIWKKLSGLPVRVEELEKRLAALEGGRTSEDEAEYDGMLF